MTSVARDIKLFYNPNTNGYYADVDFQNGDFVGEEGLETMVLMCLFSDQWVAKESSYNGESRGFFAEEAIGYNLGSKLWQLDRSKLDKTTLSLFAQYAKEALEPLVHEGIYDRVETYAQKGEDKNRLDFFIAGYRPDGEIDQYKYKLLWDSQLGG